MSKQEWREMHKTTPAENLIGTILGIALGMIMGGALGALAGGLGGALTF
jgi:hypothetical protein